MARAQAGSAPASKEEPSNKGVPVIGHGPVGVEEAASVDEAVGVEEAASVDEAVGKAGPASEGARGDREAGPAWSGIMVTSARQQLPIARYQLAVLIRTS